MFMSILRPSVRARQNTLRFVYSAAVLVIFARGAVCAQPVAKMATPEEVRQANRSLPSAFANQDDFPDAPVLLVKLEKRLYWSGPDGGRLLLLPATVHFRGVTNSYCRLATMSEDFKDVKLVGLPPQANFDDCTGVTDIRYVDVNGDGLLDVVEGVRTKSNTYPAQVATALVYLSITNGGPSYCYSDAASRQLSPADLRSEESVRNALDSAKRRLGIAQFECAQ